MSDLRKPDTGRACDMLAAYEMDLLEPRQQRDFETHLLDCTDCLEEMYAMAPAAIELKTHPATYAAAARTALDAAAPSAWERLRTLFSSGGRLAYLVPAVVTAALALAVLWPQADKTSDLASLISLEPLPWAQIEVRAGSDDAQLAFAAGMAAYGAADYATAAARLNDAATKLPDGDATRQQATLYLGVSRLMAGDTTGAVDPLRTAAASSLRPVADRGRWYLAQAYVLAGQIDEARRTLETLSDSPVYRDQAGRLLDRLQP